MTSSENGLVTVPWPGSLVTAHPIPMSLTTGIRSGRREAIYQNRHRLRQQVPRSNNRKHQIEGTCIRPSTAKSVIG